MAASAAAREQVPGAEFLLRRLERATAVPAAERTPDVAAFVESVQLLREACDLLPLTADGKALLATDSQAARQQVLALLKAARARFVSPCPPVCDRPHQTHLRAYSAAWPAISEHSRNSSDMDAAILKGALHTAATCWQLAPAAMGCVASAAAAGLAEEMVQQAVREALQRLASALRQDQLPLSVEQLRYLVCCDAAEAASNLQLQLDFQAVTARGLVTIPAEMAVEVPPPAQLAALLEVGRTCTAQLLDLEPHNPKSYLVASWTAGQDGQFDRATQLSLQALQLARQQRNNWALANSVQYAVMWAGKAAKLAPDSISRSTLEAAAAAVAHPEVEQALGPCRRLLLQPWVDAFNSDQNAVCHRELQAALGRQPGLSGSRVPPVGRLQQQLDDMARRSDCSFCGQHSVGLRRCSRCKRAQYCR